MRIHHIEILFRVRQMECPWFTEARMREEDNDCDDLVANDPHAIFFYILRMQAELRPLDHRVPIRDLRSDHTQKASLLHITV